ncbi:MAG TPA: hypothetical protein VKB88_19140 [Bryobacteraceae bacterium]|nr:hypothetical protein [Bryobacteraceae bacterium]
MALDEFPEGTRIPGTCLVYQDFIQRFTRFVGSRITAVLYG